MFCIVKAVIKNIVPPLSIIAIAIVLIQLTEYQLCGFCGKIHTMVPYESVCLILIHGTRWRKNQA